MYSLLDVLFSETSTRAFFFSQRTPVKVGSNLDGLNRLVGLTKSSKFQAFQVQLLVTAMSNQIFGENTMILLALRLVKKFHYLDLTYPGVFWACCCVQSQSSAGLFNYNASRSTV